MNQNEIKRIFLDEIGDNRGYAALVSAVERTIRANGFSLPIFKTRALTVSFYSELLKQSKTTARQAATIGDKIFSKTPLPEKDVVTITRLLVSDVFKTLPPKKPGRKSKGEMTKLNVSISVELFDALDQFAKSRNETKASIIERALKQIINE